MSPTHYGALYVVIPALLLLLAPSVMRLYDAVSVSARALASAVRSTCTIRVLVSTVAEHYMVLLSYIVVTLCPYVAPNAYLRAFYRAYDSV